MGWNDLPKESVVAHIRDKNSAVNTLQICISILIWKR